MFYTFYNHILGGDVKRIDNCLNVHTIIGWELDKKLLPKYK
jgi:hypothetical protein